jgi:hypothetical protein
MPVSSMPSAEMSTRKTRRARLIALLVAAKDYWVPQDEIVRVAGANYRSMISALRGIGCRITNRTELVDGRRYSWYRLELSVSELLFQRRFQHRMWGTDEQRRFDGLQPGAWVH